MCAWFYTEDNTAPSPSTPEQLRRDWRAFPHGNTQSTTDRRRPFEVRVANVNTPYKSPSKHYMGGAGGLGGLGLSKGGEKLLGLDIQQCDEVWPGASPGASSGLLVLLTPPRRVPCPC